MSFVQLISLEQKTCRLLIAQQDGALRGTLDFQHGELYQATTGGRHGEDAAYAILGWPHVRIFLQAAPISMEDSIRTPIHQLLMEAAYRADSAQADATPEIEATTQKELAKEQPAPSQPTAPSPNAKPQPAPKSLRDQLAEQTVDFNPSWSSGRTNVNHTTSNQFLVEAPKVSQSTKEPPSAQPTSNPRPMAKGRSEFSSWVDQGFEAFKLKNYQVALQFWEKAAEIHPEDRSLAHNLKLVRKKLEAGGAV